MIIDGFEKLTLLDYPGHLACMIFTRGCNFKCPYCQNSSLIRYKKEPGKFSEDEIIEFLKQRQGKLEGIVISGGEPTIQKGLKDFIKKVKKLNFKVKLDTNGSNPQVIKELLEENLVDYIAMDIKNDLDNYEMVTDSKVNKNAIKKSIKLISDSKIDYEFRTTIMKECHKLDNLKKILELIKNKKYYIQNFRVSDDVIDKSLSSFTDDELKLIKEELCKYPNVILRDL